MFDYCNKFMRGLHHNFGTWNHLPKVHASTVVGLIQNDEERDLKSEIVTQLHGLPFFMLSLMLGTWSKLYILLCMLS